MGSMDFCPYVRSVSRFVWETPVFHTYRAYDSRLFYIISGNACIEADGVPIICSAGGLFLIPAGIPYCIKQTPSGDIFEFFCVNFDYTQCKSDLKETIRVEIDFKIDKITQCFDDDPFDKVIYLPHMDMMFELLKIMYFEYTIRQIYFREKLNANITNILITAARKISFVDSSNILVESVIEYLQTHFAENLSNNSVAKYFHYHPHYLNQIIKCSTRMTLHQYIQQIRLQQAEKLLYDDEIPIYKVAERVGFLNVAHFSTFFRIHIGISPSEYRRNTKPYCF